MFVFSWHFSHFCCWACWIPLSSLLPVAALVIVKVCVLGCSSIWLVLSDLPPLSGLCWFLLYSLSSRTYLCFGVCGLYFVSMRKVTRFTSFLYCFCTVFRRKGKMLIWTAMSLQKLLFLFIVISLWLWKEREVNLSCLLVSVGNKFWSFLMLSEIICL